MADDGRLVTVFNLGDWVLAGTDAVKKVAHVIAADFEANRVVRQRRAEEFGLAGRDPVAVDPNPAVGADEFHAIALPGLLEHLAERAVIQRGPDDLLDVIGPSQGRFVLTGGGVTIRQGR